MKLTMQLELTKKSVTVPLESDIITGATAIVRNNLLGIVTYIELIFTSKVVEYSLVRKLFPHQFNDQEELKTLILSKAAYAEKHFKKLKLISELNKRQLTLNL